MYFHCKRTARRINQKNCTTYQPYGFLETVELYRAGPNLAADLPATFNTGINGQNLSIAYSSAGNTTTTDVGTSPITGVVSNGTGGTACLASDYTVNLTNGVLTINPATISYTIGNDSHAYGSTASLAADLPATFNTGTTART